MRRDSVDGDGARTPGPPVSTPLRVLHVVVQAGPTNSQWNEHCLPAADERQLTVCSLLPARVAPDPRITMLVGDGTRRGALDVVRRALRAGEYDVVHVHAPVSAAVLMTACVLERRSWDDVVLTLHNSWPNIRPRNRVFAALAVAAFPTVVACSRSAAESIPGYLRRLAADRLEVVPNGVDVDRVDRALAPGTPEEPAPAAPRVTVANVGRLIPIKNQTALLTAFARVAGPHDSLVIVGEGPLRGALEDQARELGIADRVQMPGLLPRDEVYRLLSTADVFVSPSYGEGLPLSVLEAMAAGVPAVLSDIPPHREIVEASGIAALVPTGDVDSLATAMARLRDLSPDERAALGSRCRRLVLDRFSLRSMAEGYHRVYAQVSARPIWPTEEVV